MEDYSDDVQGDGNIPVHIESGTTHLPPALTQFT
jgi:hypothetical protein